MDILKINNLKVIYNNTAVLNINNLSVSECEIVGIIGANGAGKTTLINCILNEIHYTGDIIRKFTKDDVGIQFQTNSYNDLMKVSELIKIVTKKRRIDNSMRMLCDKFDITSILNKKINNLSGGEKQRLTLFLVLYLNPKILFLDELTTGLDFEKRQKLLKIVREYSKGKTVFTVTHYFDEIQNWATKILVLYKGKKIFYGTFDELKKRHSHFSVIKVSSDFDDNHFSILNDEDDDFKLIVTNSLEEQTAAINLLNNLNLEYEVKPCNLYSLYTLLINDYKKAKENEDYKK